VSPQLDIIQDSHSLKKFDVLERPCNAKLCNSVGTNPRDVFSFKEYFTFLGGIKSTDAIQKAGFPRAIGPNDCEDLVLKEAGADFAQGLNPSESQGKVFNLYNGFVIQLLPTSLYLNLISIFFSNSLNIEK